MRGACLGKRARFDEFSYLRPTIGPIAQSIDDCILGLKVQLDSKAHEFDPLQPPQTWNQAKFEMASGEETIGQIKIGILQESPFLPVSDAVRRAMKETERSLKELGYLVVPYFLTDEVWKQGMDLMMSLVANGYLSQLLSDIDDECETLSPSLGSLSHHYKLGKVSKAMNSLIYSHVLG